MANKTTGQTIGAIVGGTIGFIIGGPQGALIGASLGYAAGTMVDPPSSDTGDMPQMASYPVQRSNKGTPVPKVYGTVRVAGNILWMGPNHPYTIKESSGGKGGGGTETVTGSGNRRSFLIGLCEGPAIVLRMWKGKEEISLNNATFFNGDNLVDTGINALTGETYSNYTNTCCVFFNEFEIGTGGALPNFTFEVVNYTSGKTPITTQLGLQAMNDDLSGDYELLRNIDLAGFAWTRVGDTSTPFTGTFDGRFFTVSNLTMTVSTGFQGMFGDVSGTIENLLLTNVNITSTSGFVGALAGRISSGTVKKCHVSGTISASSQSGMFIGTLSGGSFLISQCSAKGTLTFLSGADKIGGFVGSPGSTIDGIGIIEDCYSQTNLVVTGTGSASQGIGGFLGERVNAFLTINRCYATGIVPQLQYFRDIFGRARVFPTGGGIVGNDNNKTVTFSDVFWDTQTTGTSFADSGTDERQIVNLGGGPNPSGGTYTVSFNSITSGAIPFNAKFNSVPTLQSYLDTAFGINVIKEAFPDTSLRASINHFDIAGGGFERSDVAIDITIDSSGLSGGPFTPVTSENIKGILPITSGITGKTTGQMQTEAAFTNWDFDTIWIIDEVNNYPKLRWSNSSGGDENPAVIIKDLLINDRYGAGIDESTHIDTASFASVETFCENNGLLFSFTIDTQKPVLDWINLINSHFQGYLYFSEGKISLGILKEETSVFNITRDQLVIEEGENPDPPIRIEKRLNSETANRIEVTWRNRGKTYDTSVAIAMDEVDQRVTGKVRKRTVQLIGITNIELAQRTAYKLLFESMYRFSTYNFILTYENMLLEVGDVGTLTDGFNLTDEKIRITSIEEDKDGRGISIQAVEDTAFVYKQLSSSIAGSAQDSDRVEDSAPTLADAQATFTESLIDKGFVISIAPGGADTNGWHIYKSFDDVTYEFIGQVNIDEPDQSPTNSTGTTISSLPAHKTGAVYAGAEEIVVDIGTVTVLDTAITDDQFFNNKRLCKIGDEIIAYKTCVQTSVAGQWKITGLIRGLFSTEPVAHIIGETFWTINIDFNFGYANSDINKTLYFKFLTLHGSSIQSLSDVSGIPYIVQGEIKRPLPMSLIRIRGREGLETYETDDVTIDFYFTSKIAGFNIGGFSAVGWGVYIMDPALIALNILLEEEDSTDILEQRFLLSEYQEEPALSILLADRNGKNPIVVNITPESELVSNQTRGINITGI